MIRWVVIGSRGSDLLGVVIGSNMGSLLEVEPRIRTDGVGRFGGQPIVIKWGVIGSRGSDLLGEQSIVLLFPSLLLCFNCCQQPKVNSQKSYKQK